MAGGHLVSRCPRLFRAICLPEYRRDQSSPPRRRPERVSWAENLRGPIFSAYCFTNFTAGGFQVPSMIEGFGGSTGQ